MKKDELEKVKAQYNRYIKIIKVIVIVLMIVAVILLSKTIYKFSIVYKVIQNNVWMDLGDNYKITTYDEKTGDAIHIQYYKNNIKKIIDSGENESYLTSDKWYRVSIEYKQYSIITDNIVQLLYVPKESLFSGETFLNERLQKVQAIKNGMNYEIGKENYNNKDYMILYTGYTKYYIDKDDFIIKYKKSGNDFYRYEIEINVVTDEDIAIPDLSDYTKMEGSE